MRTAEATEELQRVGRMTNTLIVTATVIALATFALAAHALAHPRRDGGLGLDMYTVALRDGLTVISWCAQALGVLCWSAWVTKAAKLLERLRTPNLDVAQFRFPRNLLRPARAVSELVQLSNVRVSWAGEWAESRVPLLVRAWWAAWVVRMVAGLALVVGVPLLANARGLAGLLYVACMLRDLALLVAGPLAITIVRSVNEMLEQATSKRVIEPLSIGLRFYAAVITTLVVAAVPAGAVGVTRGLHMIADSYVMALGTTQRVYFYGGITLAVVGTVVMIAATLFIARRLSRAA
jgi:hypothetical protein